MDNIFGKHASSIIHHPKLQITFVHIIGISQNICEKHLFYYACSVVKKSSATVEDRLFFPIHTIIHLKPRACYLEKHVFSKSVYLAVYACFLTI